MVWFWWSAILLSDWTNIIIIRTFRFSLWFFYSILNKFDDNDRIMIAFIVATFIVRRWSFVAIVTSMSYINVILNDVSIYYTYIIIIDSLRNYCSYLSEMRINVEKWGPHFDWTMDILVQIHIAYRYSFHIVVEFGRLVVWLAGPSLVTIEKRRPFGIRIK